MALFKGLVVVGAFASAASAGGGAFDLSQYQLADRVPLPALEASEASAVTFNWDTNTLFVLGDEGEWVAEVSKAGALISSMALTGFDDTEGLTYIGAGAFAIAEERMQDVFEFAYAAGGTAARADLRSASLGPDVGNVGIEGICLDPVTGRYLAVKEKTPQRVLDAAIDFGAGLATANELFTPNLGVLDLSDVQVLSGYAALAGDPDAENLLIYSQESALLLEVTRSGEVVSQFSLAGLVDNAEGVTIDADGVIYIVGETPEMFVLTPVPAPASMLVLAGAALAVRRRR